ncbi:glycoside hydrolase family 1 protein [Bipolaris oryzae ATCC 44560]|uniref:Glycoside hydrolase family 1 protein n=1 Tax=Bipolaris oryzae ATCC 44560 TaxID=930090 RepID=W6YYB2_COCMI|nr:glycoside hydrolase family 1 protein [Bipolaris oryzae ATCC 44560]EUC40549.1 glycoside hydrolase family 1 protein [Bipolaris oryzae ATCC 44560]
MRSWGVFEFKVFSYKMDRLAPLAGLLLLARPIAGAAANGSSSLSFAQPTGYSTSSYNASAQPTPFTRTDYSHNALAALWDQVGPVVTGTVTTTVEPTLEPSVYPQPDPRYYHALVGTGYPETEGLKLPKNFVWGLSSSAYQIEGAAKDEGKGPSIWDLLSHRVPNFVADNTTGDVVAQHYYLYKQDFARLAKLGIKAFSPSFSWPRFFPFGNGPVNEEAVAHYDDVIATMHANEIHPSVTLFHWDTPLAIFNEYGGWTDRRVVDDFFNYAKFVITRYDAFVDEWFTINEPQYCNWQYASYPAGEYYPAPNGVWPGIKARFLCGHYTLLAHAKVAKWYHEEFKGRGRITFKNSGNYYEANSTKPEDEVARQRNFDFSIGWFGGCWTDGDYPQSLKDTLGDLLPEFTQEEKDLIKGSCDFYAIDPYSSFVAFEVNGGLEACTSNRSHPSFPDCAGSASIAPNGFPIGPAADPAMSWFYSAPAGVRRYLKHITQVLFPSIPDIVVSEFGFAEPFEAQWSNINAALWDLKRADYYQQYLDNILLSIHVDGVNVTGAWGWSIYDNFEWLLGTSVRFGLQYVDYESLERYPKANYKAPLLATGCHESISAPSAGKPSPVFVLADETSPDFPSPIAADRPSTPPSPASSTSPVISAPSTLPGPTTNILPSQRTPAGKRRYSFSDSDDHNDHGDQDPLSRTDRGRLTRHTSKRRRRLDGTMRLDNDDSKTSQSPSRNFTNGSSQSSAPRSPLGKHANGGSHNRTESNGSYTNGGPVANGGASVPATFFGHDREEVTRILIQSLTDLGYHNAASALCKESGFQLEGPTVAAFRSSVLNGDWEEAEELLFGSNANDNGGGVGLDASYGKPWGKSRSKSGSRQSAGLTLAEGANREVMLFWLKQQKYLELLERRDLSKALQVLRQELTPLHQDVGRLHALSAFMMCQSAEDLRHQAQWDGARGESRMHLLSDLSRSISPSVMIPEHRLAVLLDEVKDSWIANCLYHNTAASPSLYLNHNCERDDFPTKAVLDLRHHKDEVWFLQYSNDGTKLASTSKDCTIIIYETSTYRVLHQLDEHRDSGVTHLAWSPDDTKIVTCCSQPENSARIWDVKSGACIQCISDFTYPCTTAAWDPSGTRVIIGSQDDRMGCGIWDLNGDLKHNFCDGGARLRANDIAVSPNGERLVIITESSIAVFDFVSYEKIAEFQLDDVKLTSVMISQDSRHMLVSMSPDQIKLMEIDTGDVIQRFEAHVQKQFIIRSAFGGADENFVVSGSEDSRIYIWRSNGLLIEALDAHPGCVNSVAWHPKDPTTFASAGDDMRVKIWKPASASPIPTDHSGYER